MYSGNYSIVADSSDIWQLCFSERLQQILPLLFASFRHFFTVTVLFQFLCFWFLQVVSYLLLNLEFPALPYLMPITAIGSWLPEYRLNYGHEIMWWLRICNTYWYGSMSIHSLCIVIRYFEFYIQPMCLCTKEIRNQSAWFVFSHDSESYGLNTSNLLMVLLT